MPRLHAWACVPVLAAMLAGPAAVADEPSIGARIDDALQDALKAMDALIDRFPGYEAPEVLPNGDIIMRKRRDPGARPPGAPGSKDDPKGSRTI